MEGFDLLIAVIILVNVLAVLVKRQRKSRVRNEAEAREREQEVVARFRDGQAEREPQPGGQRQRRAVTFADLLGGFAVQGPNEAQAEPHLETAAIEAQPTGSIATADVPPATTRVKTAGTVPAQGLPAVQTGSQRRAWFGPGPDLRKAILAAEILGLPRAFFPLQ